MIFLIKWTDKNSDNFKKMFIRIKNMTKENQVPNNSGIVLN